jgi:hypothetical protein
MSPSLKPSRRNDSSDAPSTNRPSYTPSTDLAKDISPSLKPSRRNDSSDAPSTNRPSYTPTDLAKVISPSLKPSRRNDPSDALSTNRPSYTPTGLVVKGISPSLKPSRRKDASDATPSTKRPSYTTDIAKGISLSPSHMPSRIEQSPPSKYKTKAPSRNRPPHKLSKTIKPSTSPKESKHLISKMPSASPPSSKDSKLDTCSLQNGSDLYGRETDHILPIKFQYELYLLDRRDSSIRVEFLQDIELFTLNFIVTSHEFFPNCMYERSGDQYLEESFREVGIASYPVDYEMIGKLITIKTTIFLKIKTIPTNSSKQIR